MKLPLPLESIDIGELTIALRYRGNSSTRLQVGVMEYALEAETFTALDTLTPGSGWQRATVPLAPFTGTGRYLALMATGGGSVEIADLRVARCLIDSVRLYDLTDASVAVAWDTLSIRMNSPSVRWASNLSATTGAAPRYFGRREKWQLTQPKSGRSRMGFLSICP